jgi:hypothetical protein
MHKYPTLGQLAKTAARLQRKPLATSMFTRGEHAQPTPAIKEIKRAPPPGSVTTGLTATRIIHEKPKAR